jgi:hypothetical protein
MDTRQRPAMVALHGPLGSVSTAAGQDLSAAEVVYAKQ